MKFKRVVALLLCAVMLMCVFTSCNKSVEDVIDEYENDGGRNFEKARKTYDGDKVVLTIEGEDITWDEFFNWICYSIGDYESSNGHIYDFAEETDGHTFSDAVLENAIHYLTLFKGVEKNAPLLGVDFPLDVDEQVQEQKDTFVEQYGGEEAFQDFIDQYYGGNEEMFEYIAKIDTLYPLLFNSVYGENGEKVSDEDLKAGAEGYIMAKHILVNSVDEDGNALSDEELSAAKDKINNVKALLDAYEGDDLESYFDELMADNTEDTGYATSPDGYLFTEGNMVTEFYDAALALEEGKYSDIVESAYGYHIILRIPIDPDAVPIMYMTYGMSYSLRYIVANKLFNDLTDSWIESVDVNTTEFYDTIDLAQAFPAEKD